MKKKNHKQSIREQICTHAQNLFPDYEVEFTGQQGHAAKKFAGTFGFRLKHKHTGKYKGNIIWLNSEYGGMISEGWVKRQISGKTKK